jgi:hypothetical protein
MWWCAVRPEESKKAANAGPAAVKHLDLGGEEGDGGEVASGSISCRLMRRTRRKGQRWRRMAEKKGRMAVEARGTKRMGLKVMMMMSRCVCELWACCGGRETRQGVLGGMVPWGNTRSACYALTQVAIRPCCVQSAA